LLAISGREPPRHAAPLVRDAQDEPVAGDEQRRAEPALAHVRRHRGVRTRPQRQRDDREREHDVERIGERHHGSGADEPGETMLVTRNQTASAPATIQPAFLA
jgi:hypothetical protein